VKRNKPERWVIRICVAYAVLFAIGFALILLEGALHVWRELAR
jgi:multidrug transporter EmrE-like cation transporter